MKQSCFKSNEKLTACLKCFLKVMLHLCQVLSCFNLEYNTILAYLS